MKKTIYTVLLAVALNTLTMAQAVLPASWNFATTSLPTGWSEVNVNSATSPYYAGSGNPAPAYKLDVQGDMLIVNFASTPGNVSYNLAGNNTGGAWQGTILVQESANGTTWTTAATYTNGSINGTYQAFNSTLNAASRYIRFNFTVKVSGNNIGLDNVNITAGTSPNQEIAIKQSGTTYVNGSTISFSSPVSTANPIPFAIFNNGLATLNISNITISGAAAADYAVGTFPSTVSGTSNSTFTLTFTPSTTGTRSAVMTISNDDPINSTYIINLDGIGGNYATEPIAQPTNLNFSNIKSYRFSLTYSAASPAPGGYIVLRQTGSPVTDLPSDGVNYKRGDVIGASSVAYVGTSTNMLPANIVANTQYHFAVFAFNGVGQYKNYLTTNPLTGNVTSAGSMQGATYYSGISTANTNFVSTLHTKINAHTVQLYSNYGPLMISKFYARDTTNNQRVVTCVYSGLEKVFAEPWDWTSNDFSREHTYCQSWQPTYNCPSQTTFQSLPEYNDYHMITPTNQNSVNAIRSNYPLGEVVGTPQYTYLGCKIGLNAAGKKVFEPRDSDKGDAARCLFYQTICYTTVANSCTPVAQYGGSWSLPNYITATIPYGQDQAVLKKWHYQDPIDNLEIAHNDYVDSLQGNRNPFIDSMNFVCYIDFSNMTYISNPALPCAITSVNEMQALESNSMFIAPNPNNGNFMLSFYRNENSTSIIRVFDVTGKMVYNKTVKANNGLNALDISLQSLSKGLYSVELTTANNRQTQRLIIE
jgi:endonuclease I